MHRYPVVGRTGEGIEELGKLVSVLLLAVVANKEGFLASDILIMHSRSNQMTYNSEGSEVLLAWRL